MQIHIMMTKQFIISGTITIYLNDAESAWIGNGQDVILNALAGENKLLFKFGFRSKSIKFISNSDVNVMVKWNRLTGGIDALCTGADVQVLK
ncbi:hypothetical protein SDC9_54248 [bioreactor metagenome]|uniref:Uncharacterized protein n=1 Tax=bioreactor metagenome TaxID=1076179 RepID=A0A644WW72_9ZZZZ